MTLHELYAIADNNDIDVYHFDLNPIRSMSVPGAIGIDTNLIENTAEEKEQLAHELGHCILGAFYTGTSSYELKEQKEYRADKWAIKKLIPFEELAEALQNGITEPWQLAEYFNVPQSLINKATKLYESKLLELKTKFLKG